MYYLRALGHLDQMLSGYQVCLLSQGKKEALGGGKWGGEKGETEAMISLDDPQMCVELRGEVTSPQSLFLAYLSGTYRSSRL